MSSRRYWRVGVACGRIPLPGADYTMPPPETVLAQDLRRAAPWRGA
ncbi:MAG TPA: hypothetical protein VME21_11600 [Steroidobacteraceae bacterium]|nr:hypothetical protein [Steroidobacteraceae bacterium]